MDNLSLNDKILARLAENMAEEERAALIALAKQSDAPGAEEQQHLERENISISPFSLEKAAKQKKEANAEERNVANGGKRLADQPLPQRRLPIPIRKRIVEMFACFQSVKAIQDALKEEFGLSVSRATLLHYDPDRSKALSPKLRVAAESIRERYITESARVGVAHQAHRLRILTDIVEKAIVSKDFTAALKGLELAAKETGALATQTVEHRGVVAHVHGDIAEARAELAMRLQAMVDSGTLPALAPPTPLHPAPAPSVATPMPPP